MRILWQVIKNSLWLIILIAGLAFTFAGGERTGEGLASGTTTTTQVIPGKQGTQGPTGAQGPAGAPGPTGPAGSPGAVGITLDGDWVAARSYQAGDVVAINGALYLALKPNTNDAPPSSNWQLLTGAPGPQGPQGVQGVPGPPGTAGKDGAPGAVGAEGASGPIGPAGVAGQTGATGSAGPAGPQGAPGSQGSPGPTGDTGPAGAAGPPGPPGPPGTDGGLVCPKGFGPGVFTLNAPGGQVSLYVCMSTP